MGLPTTKPMGIWPFRPTSWTAPGTIPRTSDSPRRNPGEKPGGTTSWIDRRRRRRRRRQRRRRKNRKTNCSNKITKNHHHHQQQHLQEQLPTPSYPTNGVQHFRRIL